MFAYLVSVAVGIVFIILGADNIKGNISTIHWYHRHRVSEADKAAFGKRMGIGMISCGTGVLAFGLLALLEECTGKAIFIMIGSYCAAAGLAVGIGIFIYTTIKYNKGIF